MAENLPVIIKVIDPQIQKYQWTPKKINVKKPKPAEVNCEIKEYLQFFFKKAKIKNNKSDWIYVSIVIVVENISWSFL